MPQEERVSIESSDILLETLSQQEVPNKRLCVNRMTIVVVACSIGL